MHDSLDIVLNDFSGSTGLIVHHVVVRIALNSLVYMGSGDTLSHRNTCKFSPFSLAVIR